MNPKDAFANHCAELLMPLGPVRVRRMFGGHGIYLDNLFVAIVVGEVLYLKADAESAPRFDAAGCAAFAYSVKGRGRMSLNYRAAPADAMESAALMQPWATLAMGAALRAR
jgi:DNA transformation protein and related proteins